MSKATIRIPTPLRAFTGGAAAVEVEAATVGQALEILGRRHEGILERILDTSGGVRGFVNVYLGEINVKQLGGLETPLPPQTEEISIIPAVAGGTP